MSLCPWNRTAIRAQASAGGDPVATITGSRSAPHARTFVGEGKLDEKEIEIDVSASIPAFEVMAPPGMEEMTDQLQGMFKNLSNNKTKSQKMKIKDALSQLHFPSSSDNLSSAIYRLKFDEHFIHQIFLGLIKSKIKYTSNANTLAIHAITAIGKAIMAP